MVRILATFGGLLAGGLFGALPGAVAGALLGYLLATAAQLERRVRQLESGSERAAVDGAADARPAPPSTWRPPASSAASLTAAEPVPRSVVNQAGDEVVRDRPEAQREEREGVAAWLDRARAFLLGGNLAVRVGVVVLFFGVAFLVRFAADRGLVPIEVRLAGVALGGIALLVFGWRQRLRRPGYAVALLGGGIGILYLVVFAALRLYHLLPPLAAFMLLVAIAACGVLLALLLEAQALAVLASAGGFLAPVLASTGSGSHVLLFSYYLLLDVAILAGAWFRPWRVLNLVGFVFTFGIASLWGYRYYAPAHLATTEPFLLLFFVLFTALAVLYAWRQPPGRRGRVDGTLLFGTPIVAFALQAALVDEVPYGLAWSAVVAGAFYLGLARWLGYRLGVELRTLVEALFALGVVFTSLAIPLALDGRWTAAAWALEGGAMVWIGVRQQRLAPRLFGILLQVAGGLLFLADLHTPSGAWPLLNGTYLGGAGTAAAALFSGWCLWRAAARLIPLEGWLPPLLVGWGWLWWHGIGLYEIERHLASSNQHATALLLAGASAFVASALARRLGWRALAVAALALLPLLLLLLLPTLAGLPTSHPFADGRWLAWPVALAVAYHVLRRHEAVLSSWPRRAGHLLAAWIAVAVMTAEGGYLVDALASGATSWRLAAWGALPALAVVGAGAAVWRRHWPLTDQPGLYLGAACGGGVAWLVAWLTFVNIAADGAAAPLVYLPLLNPIDLASLLALVALPAWWYRLRRLHDLSTLRQPFLWFEVGLQELFWTLFGMLGLGWLTAALARAVHHWDGVPYRLGPLLHSMVFQASVSLAWTAVGLSLMVAAARSGQRAAWFAGAATVALVVVKLFLVDLGNSGTVARIVSFLGVGVLLLAVGYLTPVPPRDAGKEEG